MDVLGTVISLLKGMFQPLLGTHFGHSYVISRCLGLCLLVKWIERSRGLEKDLCFNFSDFLVTFFFQIRSYMILKFEVFQTDDAGTGTGNIEVSMHSFEVGVVSVPMVLCKSLRRMHVMFKNDYSGVYIRPLKWTFSNVICFGIMCMIYMYIES